MLNSVGNLTVTNCTLQNFVKNGGDFSTGTGILIAPTSGTLTFTITNTTASNNAIAGIQYMPGAVRPASQASSIIWSRMPTVRWKRFRYVWGIQRFDVVAISNSIASDNTDYGVYVQNTGSGTVKASIDNVSTGGNGAGIGAGIASVLLGRSVITGNGTGVNNITSPNTFYTYKDNRINLNGTDVNGAMNTTFLQQ